MSTISPPFALTLEQIAAMSAYEAIDFLRRLLWAEAARTGVGRYLIDVPGCINTADGGLDAYILGADPSGYDLICDGNTGYQVKAGDISPAECKNELHQRNDPSYPLKPAVAELVNSGGAYCLVLFADITAKQKQSREEALRAEFKRLRVKPSEVRVLTASDLHSLSARFVCLGNLRSPNLGGALDFGSWKKHGSITKPAYFATDERRQYQLDRIRGTLRDRGGVCPVIRCFGLPGVGKTRLLFEALSPDDLQSHVLYFPSASGLLASQLLGELQKDSSYNSILVVDECDLNSHHTLVNALSNQGDRLALITASYQPGSIPPPTIVEKVEPLDNEHIEAILDHEIPGMPAEVKQKIAKFSGGYPRIVVLLAGSYSPLAERAEEFLRLSDDDLINRLVGGTDTMSSEFVLHRRVLTALSLFERIGTDTPVSEETDWLANAFELPLQDLRRIIKLQRDRGLLQGQRYVYVTPLILRSHLIHDWWSANAYTKESFLQLVASIPDTFRLDLTSRLIDHIPLIATTDAGMAFVRSCLSEEGMFEDGELLKTKLGEVFFSKLADVDLKAALSCLSRTVGQWSLEERLNFHTGRSSVRWTLQKIAVYPDLFQDAARLLLLLAEAENENFSNNCSGVFANLFTPAPSPVAPTAATPEERFPIIQEAIESTSHNRRMLGIRACDAALNNSHFLGFPISEDSSPRIGPPRWTPKTYGDIFEAYRRVWTYLLSALSTLNEMERQEGYRVLLKRSREVFRIAALSEMVVDTLRLLAQEPDLDKRKVLETVLGIQKYERKGINDIIKQKLKDLEQFIIGSSFESRLRRWAGMSLLEDQLEEGKDTCSQQLRGLAEYALLHPDELEIELAWLVTSQAANGHAFGKWLGEIDSKFSFLQPLVTALGKSDDDGNAFFASGYLAQLKSSNYDIWLRVIRELESNDMTVRFLPEIIWRCGPDDNTATLLLDVIKTSRVPKDSLAMFTWGGVLSALSEPVMFSWINVLIEANDPKYYWTALDLFHAYWYLNRDSGYRLPDAATLHLLTHTKVFQTDRSKVGSMQLHDWHSLATEYLATYPDRYRELAEFVLQNLGAENSVLEMDELGGRSVLESIARLHPAELWELLEPALQSPMDKRAFELTMWLSGGFDHGSSRNAPITLFPSDRIFAWVDEGAKSRAPLMAGLVPNELSMPGAGECLARELLVRYGDRKDVRNALVARFSTESWSGSESGHYRAKRDYLLTVKAKETNQRVRSWIDQYVLILDHSIESASLREEREGW